MTAAEVYLHVGLPKTGTTAIQNLLARHRAEVAEAGLLYPDVAPEGMFHAAIEVIEWKQWGVEPAEIKGLWAAHCAQVREHAGRSLISHEVLGRARPRQVRDALAELEGTEVHLVVTARDLARQVTATWQERIKNGRRYSFSEFLEREGVHTAGTERGRSGAFWREQDLLGVLDRWGRGLPAERVHVVVCPPAGAPREELLRRFGAALGVDLTRFDVAADRANRSLAAPQVELLRQVNVLLEGRLEGEEYIRVVKRDFVPRLLASLDGPPLVAPDELRGPFAAVTAEWLEAVRGRGYQVHGDLEDLRPTLFGAPGGTASRRPPEEAVEEGAALIAEMLLTIAEARGPLPEPESARESRKRPWKRLRQLRSVRLRR